MRAEGKQLRRCGVLFIVSGPSGSGKSSVSDWVLGKMRGLDLSTSVTTRARRGDEREGEHYRFVSDAEFDRMLANNELAEWALVHDQRYGTPCRDVERATAAGRDLLLDIDVQGARQMKARYPDAVSIFLMPPSRSVLAHRLAARNTDDAASVERRLGNACEEIAASRDYDFVIVNEVLDDTCSDFAAIVAAERRRVGRLNPDDLSAVIRAFEDVG